MQDPKDIQDIQRPPKELIDKLYEHVSSATAAGDLNKLGVSNCFIPGPTPYTPGTKVVGPAVTLQFMPKRDDVYADGEYTDPEVQLHRHALYLTQEGDVVVVDARGSMTSGVFGNMMLTYFKGAGGAGVVIDGCIRDYPERPEGLGLWLKGVTPNFHTQTEIFPYAVNVPVAVGGTYVAPGDIIIADDDGVVVVPIHLAEELAESGQVHAEWEEFSREKLEQGGDLRRYYPLTDAARPEYEEWKKANGK
ncbi:MAG: ribonuclease activity regulator RraA [Chloroflexi bacterium]|nr:ribonuclease activity regulator RraA [Chloroflexota bacterium]|tara:strand:- start:3335 stop:4081 length:747 start_codon:yes stop_codon:yes gene_type:complete